MSDLVEKPDCPRCSGTRVSRVQRKGLMQLLVWCNLGLYPWECSSCHKAFLFKSRGKLKRRRGTTGKVHVPGI